MKFKLTFTSPVVVIFTVVCAALFIADGFFESENLISSYFTVPGNMECPIKFDWTLASDYIKIFSHIFGTANWNQFFLTFAFIILVGPVVENRYGSAMTGLMIVTSGFVSGVVNVCLIPVPLCGAGSVSVLFLVLFTAGLCEKREIPFSTVIVILVFVTGIVYSIAVQKNLSTISQTAGGVCASVFGFLVAPKEYSRKKTREEDEIIPPKPAPTEKRKPVRQNKDSDETIIG